MNADNIKSMDMAWALGSACALHGKPFDAGLLLKQFAPPYDAATLVGAARTLGFQARLADLAMGRFGQTRAPAFLLPRALRVDEVVHLSA
jgi:subfamily B ATP-binding cassette protein HlyB/CyaB